MTVKEDVPTINNKPGQWWSKPAPITIIGVVLLGVLGSILYDLLVKPGLTTGGRVVLKILTLGSATLRDAAYESAALDPTPVTGLLLLYIPVMVALGIPLFLFGQRKGRKRRGKLKKL
jgi:hypothetical protein